MRIHFDVGPVWTGVRITDASVTEISDALAVIRSATSARPEGYKFAPSYRGGMWDGFIRLFKNGKFPSGLIQTVTEAFPKNTLLGQTCDCAFPLLDRTVIQPDMFQGITMRQYQLDAANKLLVYGRGIAKMATNSGKTEVMAAMCKAITPPQTILILTHKKDLLHQTAERIADRLGEPVGKIGDGLYETKRITVSTVQTLSRHSPDLSELSCLIADEAHHCPSKTFQNVMMDIPAPMRFGFSGTPLHNDKLEDMLLIGATGPILVDITNTDLIDSGISAPPHITMYTITGEDSSYNDKWIVSYDKLVVNNVERNATISRLLNTSSYASALVLVERIEHGNLLRDWLPGSMFVHGSLDTDVRKEALDALRAGNRQIVIATPIFDEGVDVPAVDLLVLAGGGKAPIRLLQRLGRGMRMKEGKTRLEVVDFVDDTNKYLLEHSLERAQLYESEDFQVSIVEGATQCTH